ncbi:hypothetical protein AALP_AA6G269700 [Arabis alpina]|uniref:RING-type domain-containing protein n=1 Tax=Arabis alpina TaxID=50452 RepID=A0A087GRZ0_ARAAL|nr:hypothetical protein AALP_AA6G269700 [Arabis alpina]
MASEDNPSHSLVVEKSEVVLVKPSKPTPEVSLSLSTIDNDPYLEVILKTICVYAPKPYLEDEANHDAASLLQDALSDALFYYYPLAGKLHRKSDDNRLQLNCTAGDGVPFLKATTSCTLASLNYLDTVGDAAYQLVPCFDPVKGGEGYDPLAFQVTKFACGGITIGMAHSHSVCDGVGVAQFFRTMIELASGKTQPTVIPVWDRERLTFNGELGDMVDWRNHLSSFPCTDHHDMVREILNITSEDILKLKKTIVEDELVTNADEKKVVVTTLEILAAQLWRARCRALNLSPDEIMVVLGLAVGIRGVKELQLPQGYYGNAFLNGIVALPASELRDSSLSRVVSLIKDMKRAALDKRFVLGQLNEIERRLKVAPSPGSVGMESMLISDWRQIGLHYDGWGEHSFLTTTKAASSSPMDNKEEEPKQPPSKLPDLTLFEQANSEIALAAFQANSHFAPDNHDSASSRVSMIESDEESEDDEEEDEEEGSNENYYEYFDSNGFGEDEDEIDEFLEDQESNSNLEDDDFLEEEDDDFLEEEDEIDPDQLSYEELIALGDFIGVEKRGLTTTEISTCLNESNYVFSHNKNDIDRCVVCQMEFEEGESLVVLRLCNHPYHSECITKWLQTKKICPICCSEPSLS